MVDVAHDRHDRRTRGLRSLHRLLVLGDVRLGIVQLGSLRLVTHLLDEDDRGLLVEHLVDGDHRTQLHQRLDHLGSLHRHLVRKLADSDRLRHRHLAHDRLGRRVEGRPFLLCVARLVASAARMPPGNATAGVATRLDHPAAC